MPENKTQKFLYSIYNTKGEKISQAAVVTKAYDPSSSSSLLTQAVRVYLANQRQGTSSTKTRSEVAGSTRKIYRQKGTGRARHGDIKAPIFVGGGIVFGPHPRDFQLKLNKKMSKKAFLISLLDKIKNNKLIIIEDLSKIAAKTKELTQILKKFFSKNIDREKFLLIHNGERNLILACRNIRSVTGVLVSTVNTYDLLSHTLVITEPEVVDKLFKRVGLTLKKKVVKKTKKS